MLRNKLLYRVVVSGSNLTNFLTKLIQNNIIIYDVDRDKNSLSFSLTARDYVVLKSIGFNNYSIETISHGGKSFLKRCFLSRIGLILGLIISLFSYVFLSNRVFYIQITGLNRIPLNEVMQSLNDIGISRFSIKPKDTVFIEKYLEDNFDFSLVSVVTKGNAVIINIKEEIEANKDYIEITAEYDMVINEIEVFAGTTTLVSGDIVRLGDVIVFPFEYIGEEKISVKPRAKIFATRYISESYTFYNEEIVKTRTGKSITLNCDYYMGNIRLFGSGNDNSFDDFEIESNKEILSQYFIPIEVSKVIAYELEEITVNRDFSREKDDIINNIKSSCMKGVETDKILGENVNIIEMPYGYIINYHLETELYLNY